MIPKGENFGSKQGANRYLLKGGNFDSKGEEKKKKLGETKGDNGFRGRPSHHWMMVSIQASVSGFQLFSISINLSIFANLCLL